MIESSTADASGPRWFVVHTQPWKEAFVERRIEDLGLEAFLPRVLERRRRRDHHLRLGPLFPGYLFAKLSEAKGELPSVRWLHGVRRVLGDREKERPIDDAVVEMIRARVDACGRLRLDPTLRRGGRVRICNGPLAGLVGVLDGTVTDTRERVFVLLELFDRMARVEVEARDLVGLRGR